MRMLVVIWLGTAAAWTSVPRLASSRAAVATSHSRPSMLLEEAQGTEALLRLCAATDRGQRCTSAERAIIASLVRDMEGEAPRADATQLNGNWRLLYTSTPSVYRSSPFFWAFKQAHHHRTRARAPVHMHSTEQSAHARVREGARAVLRRVHGVGDHQQTSLWALKQALAGSTTPIAIPGGGVQPGDAVAEATYAIT